MARHANVRVEARRLPPNATKSDRDRSVQQLIKILKRMCDDYGVLHSLKEHEFFVRKTDIKRRKRQNKLRAPIEALKEKTDERYSHRP